MAGVAEVDILSPTDTVCLIDPRAALLLEARVTVGGEVFIPEGGVSWTVSPTSGAVLTQEGETRVQASFATAGIYTVSASVETDGIVRTDTRAVVVGSRAVAEGLVAEWGFEGESSAVTDSSGQGWDGTLQEAAGRGAGVVGSAYRAQGQSDQGVTLAQLPSLPEVTLCAWVKAESDANEFPRIVEGPEWIFYLGLTDGTHVECLKFSRIFNVYADGWYTPIGSIQTGRWYHVAATWRDGDEARVCTLMVWPNGWSRSDTDLRAWCTVPALLGSVTMKRANVHWTAVWTKCGFTTGCCRRRRLQCWQRTTPPRRCTGEPGGGPSGGLGVSDGGG